MEISRCDQKGELSPQSDMRHAVEEIVSNLIPWDELESLHIQETLAWIRSGSPIFRLKKPDVPPKHLVAYFVVFDEDAQKILLVDHKKAQLWLPAGGHVELNEHPQDTVIRECVEELGVPADFLWSAPLFLTSTVTVGLTAGHTDVSLWYVLKENQNASYSFDSGEFNAVHWFGFDDLPYALSDPHMKRFMEKLKEELICSASSSKPQ